MKCEICGCDDELFYHNFNWYVPYEEPIDYLYHEVEVNIICCSNCLNNQEKINKYKSKFRIHNLLKIKRNKRFCYILSNNYFP